MMTPAMMVAVWAAHIMEVFIAPIMSENLQSCLIWGTLLRTADINSTAAIHHKRAHHTPERLPTPA